MARDVPELVGWRWLLRRTILQMLLEELQHELLGLRPPLQVGRRPDVKRRLTAGDLAALPEVQQAQQMWVPPSTDQQHRTLKPALGGLMNRPLLPMLRVASQPPPGHAIGVVALQQFRSVPQIAVVFQASADLQPGRWVSASLRLKGGQLQPPTEPEMPPVSAAFTTPVAPFVQSGHRRCGAIRWW